MNLFIKWKHGTSPEAEKRKKVKDNILKVGVRNSGLVWNSKLQLKERQLDKIRWWKNYNSSKKGK